MNNIKDKIVTLEDAIKASSLSSGMTVSIHHHLRNGDLTTVKLFETIQNLGIKDLTLNASSLSNVQDALLPFVTDGTITGICTSGMRGELGKYIQTGGKLKFPVVFMSHGCRARAIKTGEVKIDIAFIVASKSDERGNLTGCEGPSAFGAMGYPLVDAAYADYTIAITDTIGEIDTPSIQGDLIQKVALVDKIGDPRRIASGSTRLSKSPMDLLIAKKAANILIATQCIRQGFCFQAGSGAISLAVCRFLENYMLAHRIKGEFALGGITSGLVEMLEKDLFEVLYDVQTFGEDAVKSLKDNERHLEISADLYANPDNPNAKVNALDVMILSATEVDLNFNVNSLTGSQGRLMGALGGAPDTAESAKITIVVAPSMRKRIPIIVEDVKAICTPGSNVDIVVTEVGVSINPLRSDLIELLDQANIKHISIEDHRRIITTITGQPEAITLGKEIVGIVYSRKGYPQDFIYNITEQ